MGQFEALVRERRTRPQGHGTSAAGTRACWCALLLYDDSTTIPQDVRATFCVGAGLVFQDGLFRTDADHISGNFNSTEEAF
eukprot:74268-Pleurochrysis_carterae.AAC.5